MSLDVQQTDTTSTCAYGLYCSSMGGSHSNTATRQASDGGTAGSTGVSLTLDNNVSTAEGAFNYECVIGAGYTWGAGTATVRVNFTSGDSNIKLDSVDLCRVNSSCTNQATIGSSTALGLATDAGQQNVSVTCSAQSPSADDKVIAVLGFTNTNPHGSHSITILPNQLITLPFTAVEPVGPFILRRKMHQWMRVYARR